MYTTFDRNVHKYDCLPQETHTDAMVPCKPLKIHLDPCVRVFLYNGLRGCLLAINLPPLEKQELITRETLFKDF